MWKGITCQIRKSIFCKYRMFKVNEDSNGDDVDNNKRIQSLVKLQHA